MRVDVCVLVGCGALASAWARPAQADPRLECVAAAEQAQKLRSQHQLRAARDELLKCAQTACPGVVRDDCMRWLTEVEITLPSLVIQAVDPSGRNIIDVRVDVDGARFSERLDGIARPIDPGEHALHCESDGLSPIDTKVVIADGEKNRILRLRFEPLRAPPSGGTASPTASTTSGASALPYLLGGVGVVALGSFAYFGLTGRSEADRLAEGCGATKSCSEEQVRPVRNKLVAADISLGVGVVSLALATWAYLSERSGSPQPEPRTTLGVATAADRASVEVGWRF
jgi:hypothetical protein